MKKPGLPPEMIFYCKDCRTVVEADKAGRKHVYKCKTCGTKNVAFGSEKSIKGFYRVPGEEKAEKKIPLEKENVQSSSAL